METSATRSQTRGRSTAVILFGLALTSAILPSNNSVEIFTVAAFSVGLSLGVATIIEAANGVRTLIRADILILWVLYALTFLEFLFPQPDVANLVEPASAASGTYAVLVGFAGLVVGRHFVSVKEDFRNKAVFINLQPKNVFLLFVLAALLGYLHIFLAVNFDLLEAIRQM